ncbi:MAG: TRAP transporter small permease [Proteobacteria bacterium]|nr:TRAP transporter small permease [Pseudomonadota bacterium]
MQMDTTGIPDEYNPETITGVPAGQLKSPQPPIQWLQTLVATISGIGLLALMVVMAGDVFGRYLFNHPIPGAYELVEYLMAIIVPFSIAYSAAQKCHVGVDILVERLPKKIRAIVDIITQFLTIILVSIVIWQGWVGFFEAQSSSIRSAVLEIPNYPFLLAVPIGFMAFVVFVFCHLLKTIKEVLKP